MERPYSFNLFQEEKIFVITIEGYFLPKVAKYYLNDLHNALNLIDPSKYELLIDATFQKNTVPKTRAKLKKVFLEYKRIGFKKISIIKPLSKLTTKESKKMIDEINLDYELVDRDYAPEEYNPEFKIV